MRRKKVTKEQAKKAVNLTFADSIEKKLRPEGICKFCSSKTPMNPRAVPHFKSGKVKIRLNFCCTDAELELDEILLDAEERLLAKSQSNEDPENPVSLQ